MANRYYSIREAAALLEVSPQLIRRKCREGKLPGFRPPGMRDWRIPVADLEEILWDAEEKARARYDDRGRRHKAHLLAHGKNVD